MLAKGCWLATKMCWFAAVVSSLFGVFLLLFVFMTNSVGFTAFTNKEMLVLVSVGTLVLAVIPCCFAYAVTRLTKK